MELYTVPLASFPGAVDTATLYTEAGRAKLVGVVLDPEAEIVSFMATTPWSSAEKTHLDSVAAAHAGKPPVADRERQKAQRIRDLLDTLP